MLGVVTELDLDGSSSRVVLRDEHLTKCSPDLMVPGANGIKVGDNAFFTTSISSRPSSIFRASHALAASAALSNRRLP